MLLFVVDAQFDQVRRATGESIRSCRNLPIHMVAVGAHLIEGRAGQHPAPVARQASALGLVIAVEQERPVRIERLVVWRMIAQDEGLEEPRCVRKVPLRRRSIGHRLHRCIRIPQFLCERHCHVARAGKAINEGGFDH